LADLPPASPTVAGCSTRAMAWSASTILTQAGLAVVGVAGTRGEEGARQGEKSTEGSLGELVRALPKRAAIDSESPAPPREPNALRLTAGRDTDRLSSGRTVVLKLSWCL
jgi:hypothetical protein